MDPTSGIKFTPKGDGYRKSTVSGKTNKDFQKVLGRESQDDRNYSEENTKIKEDKASKDKEAYDAIATSVEETHAASKKGAVSLFDLAKPQDNPKSDTENLAMEDADDISVTGISEEMKQQSLSALFKGYGTQEKLKSLDVKPNEFNEMTANPESKIVEFPIEQAYVNPKDAAKGPQENMLPPVNLLANEKGKERVQFTAREQPDLASINPIAGPFQIAESNSIQETTQQTQVSRAADIQEVVDQIVQNIYTIKVDGRTDTLITLKQPPQFEGAHVVITGFDTAKGEFNIAFENLTPLAKQVLDARDNQISLRSALEDKGFVVHIITTTTIAETLNIAKSEQPSKGDREGSNGGFGGQKEKRDEEEAAG